MFGFQNRFFRVDTLEKFARALEVPMYQLFYESDKLPVVPKTTASEAKLYGNGRGKAAREVMKFRKLLSQMAAKMVAEGCVKLERDPDNCIVALSVTCIVQ